MFRPIVFLRALGLAWALWVCPLAVLLMVSCVTSNGALFGMGALLLGIAPVLVMMGPGRSWWRRAGLISLGGWLLITLWLVVVSPDGRTNRGLRVRNCYVGGANHYQVHALGALLPEVDQFMPGFKLVTAVDPLFTRNQAQELSLLTRGIYAELDVIRYATSLRDSGARIEMSTYEGADHFLFFSHRDRCLVQLSNWLKLH